MSLGENLQFLRKRNSITQEELAEKLEVSRQSVSKWESDTAYPEMDKLIQLCQMFNCRMDDLVQNDVSALCVEDKADYDRHFNLFSKMISLGVGLILFGISLMLLISSFETDINSEMFESIGTMIFFIFLIAAIAIFIVMGIQHSSFEQKNPYVENFYSEEEVDRFNKKFSIMVAFGVAIILIGIVITIGTNMILSNLESSNIDFDGICGSIFLLTVTIGVTTLVYSGMQKSKYDINEYNLMHDKESDAYKKDRLSGTICACLMMSAVIIYLIAGFVFGEWGMPSVVVFPIFGIGCGIASIIINVRNKN